MLPTRRMDTPFDLLQREIDRAFDRAWGNAPDAGYGGVASYPVDIHEDANNVIVEAELPGFTKQNIDVTMEQGVLTINAHREMKQDQEKTERYLHERRYTRVSRSFRLPTPVDESKIECKLNEGVLTIHLPKREEVKPRKIEVK
ncbi:Hsp20/alpha crystallin family protein [Phycisphaerales bacterium AB-hyl4]|uniref:Hsp20/alpha crystallin family protein n=1 Tax=Natronomicrosphaera hydrolytica TaxID=3242702 RepID=A0ABV4U451_9BACT